MVDLLDETFEIGLVENLYYKTMNPIEEILAFDQYSRDRGWGGIIDLLRRLGEPRVVTKRI
jgi:hypothetical protein